MTKLTATDGRTTITATYYRELDDAERAVEQQRLNYRLSQLTK